MQPNASNEEFVNIFYANINMQNIRDSPIIIIYCIPRPGPTIKYQTKFTS